MFGARQAQDGVELVDWASKLPNANGRVGMFGVSYLAINQLFTAAAVGPNSPLKAIFPVMAAQRLLPRCGRDGRGAAPAHRAGLRRGLQAAQRRQPGAGIPQSRQPSAATRRRHRRVCASADGISAVTSGRWSPTPWPAARRRSTDNSGKTCGPRRALRASSRTSVAVFLVGGWHDAFQRGAPLNYAALQNAFAGRPAEQPMQPGQPVSDRIRLMMGPWYHVSELRRAAPSRLAAALV